MGLFTKKTPEEKKAQEEKQNKKMEAIVTFVGFPIQNIGKIPQNVEVKLSLDPEERKLIITSLRKSFPGEVKLPYERIKGFVVEDEVTLSKGSSGIGRALVGHALFGGVGAVVGAVSAKGNTSLRWIATLTYEDKEGNLQELGFIKFGIGKNNYYTGKDKAFSDNQFENVIKRIVSENCEDIEEL